jgi:SOS response associated peptidase (SRAP)
MKDSRPFGIGGLWENWKDLSSGEWIRTFAIITTDANELVAEIHDRAVDPRARRLRTLAERRRPARLDAIISS